MRVLICDDHLLFAESFAAVLTALGHEVVGIQPSSQPDRAARPESIARTAPDADLCVLDPGPADPVALRKAVRALADSPADRDRCRIVVLTSEERRSAENLRSLLEARVHGVVSKHRSTTEIVTALKAVHLGGIYFDPVLVRRALTAAHARPRRHPRPCAADSLTQRELEVLGWLVHGAATTEMTAAMGISATTVRSHIKAVFAKLGVTSRLQAAAQAIALGLVEPD